MLRLSLPHVTEAAIAAVGEVLRSGHLAHGVQGHAFEAELQAWLGCRHAVLVSSGTAALHLALLALDIGRGDAVLVPDFTFPATANVVALTGARPLLVDVDARSYCATPAALEAAIAAWRGPEKLRAVMPVHEFGHPVDMASVRTLAQAHGLHVVEDAACAIGASDAGAKVGTCGDIGCFSLHPRKTLTTGEGGILTTGDDALAQRLRRLRSHGMERGPAGVTFHEAGFNYRLTDFQAALGRAQLPQLAGWITRRRALAQSYRSALAPLERAGRLVLPADHPGHSWQTFMVMLADGIDRAAVIGALADQGIETNLGAQCVSAQPSFAAYRPADGSPNAQRLYRQGLALPFCEQYGAAEVTRVAGALGSVLEASHA
ncbi:MAG TPA: DegT/DnrJ/EryC1/StrS aminotransferase family protein [Burkholderiaceae bacterium]|nr:DegT/DnrJ/EryC1/StrS aminotransferase family protein [Burkholderiaceae bacterium]